MALKIAKKEYREMGYCPDDWGLSYYLWWISCWVGEVREFGEDKPKM